MKALSNMRQINAKNLVSITDLDRTFEIYEKERETMKKITNGFNIKKQPAENIDDVTKQMKLFELVSSGLEINNEKIAKLVKEDPNRELFGLNDKQKYFINKKNFEGLTPRCVACIHGHVKMVELLLNNDADHLQKCGVIY